MNDGDGRSAAAIRLLIVDDHDLFRTGLAALLAARDGFEVVGQASGGRAGVRLARELRPDVVLMDLRMADLTGAEATREILHENPRARVVALTVSAEDAAVTEALEAGVCGFLTKDMPVEQVALAVGAAAQGAAWLSPGAAELALTRLRRDSSSAAEQPAGDELTARELEVLRLVARGLGNAEIAQTLGISAPTAKNHVSSILHKLGLSSRLQAAVYAVRRGLD
jgi:DNA-binding NarL/FixJ family response regulator